MRRLMYLLPAAAACLDPTAAIGGSPRMPVMVGGDALMDACATTGEVHGLDPKGDNFLSVRTGPGGKQFEEADRVRTGQQVTICQERGPWLGIVYAPRPGIECAVSNPRPRAIAYAGPCRSGWVHGRYVRVVAG